jgi:hypothetical protein
MSGSQPVGPSEGSKPSPRYLVWRGVKSYNGVTRCRQCAARVRPPSLRAGHALRSGDTLRQCSVDAVNRKMVTPFPIFFLYLTPCLSVSHTRVYRGFSRCHRCR